MGLALQKMKVGESFGWKKRSGSSSERHIEHQDQEYAKIMFAADQCNRLPDAEEIFSEMQVRHSKTWNGKANRGWRKKRGNLKGS